MPLSTIRERIPCRCGVDVRTCTEGCTLFVCCAGYVAEGHMSDCTSPSEIWAHGARSDLKVTEPIGVPLGPCAHCGTTTHLRRFVRGQDAVLCSYATKCIERRRSR